MFSEEDFLERIERDTQAISTMTHQDRSQEAVDSLLVLVHPGYHGINSVTYSSDIGRIIGKEYTRYCEDLYNTIITASEDGSDIMALYPEGLEEEHRRFIGFYGQEADWVPTWREAGVPTDEGLDVWGEIYNRLEEGSEVTVAGETREKCYRYNILFLDTLQKRLEKDFEIIRGPSFGD